MPDMPDVNELRSDAASVEGYPGDDALEALLEAQSAGLALGEAKARAAGIAAAPETIDPGAALDLVVPDRSPRLDHALRALVGELREGYASAIRGAKDAAPERIAALRGELARRSLDGFLQPVADEHQGEYVPLRAQRLAWLTGFGGSAGLVVVLAERAAVFVDGRYILQVRDQVDLSIFETRHITDEPPAAWLAEALPGGGRIGYDPWLHSAAAIERLSVGLEKADVTLVPVTDNPIDAVWTGQPPPPLSPVRIHGPEFTGKKSPEKRAALAEAIKKDKIDAAIVTAPDSLAWLLNIRGADVPRTPLPLSFGILHADGTADLYIDSRKIGLAVEAHLGNAVRLHPPDALGDGIAALGKAGKRVLADPQSAAAWVLDRLSASGAAIVRGPDPCVLPKATKNDVELAGARMAHVRDGAALTRFLSWLAREAPQGGVDEIRAAEKLAQFRREGTNFRDLSFDTISGAGPNGAIVHYRVTPETNRRLGTGELYLVDSGAQYLDGTTDVTRTVAIGQPTPEQRDRFTRVLKGHIALASCRFPEGTTGSQLDVLARQHLWRAGLDFDHGTGHGVGSFLSVHEGPQRISKHAVDVPLRPGMIVSNEPGYYKTGAYGIRIENLVAVIALEAPEGGERKLLGFETLTLAPIDRALVEPALMTEEEVAWLDAYHGRVRETLSPIVDADTVHWLAEMTAPIPPVVA